MSEDKVAALQRMIRESKNIVFFGGAGVSTESGIPDFRSAGGVFERLTGLLPEEALSRGFFDAHPEEFFAFYRQTLLHPDAKPNPAHCKLAELEQAGKVKVVVTQNIDGLHQKAGSRTVLELHGSVERNFCMSCGRNYPMSCVLESDDIPHCACGGIVRPDVVLYGEPLDRRIVMEAYRCMEAADLLIAAGSSLVVHPAAGLVRDFRGRHLVLINRSETPYDSRADLLIRGSVAEVLGRIV